MRVLTIIFGILMTLLGAGYYTLTSLNSFSTLLPMLFGILITLFGLLDKRFKHRHALYGSLLLAFFIFLGSLNPFFGTLRVVFGDEATELGVILLRSIIGLLCAVYIVLGIILIDNFRQGWKAFGQFMGNILARVVLIFFYFTVFIPFGLGVRLFSDPLQTKSSPDHLWRARSAGDSNLEDMRRQF